MKQGRDDIPMPALLTAATVKEYLCLHEERFDTVNEVELAPFRNSWNINMLPLYKRM